MTDIAPSVQPPPPAELALTDDEAKAQLKSLSQELFKASSRWQKLYNRGFVERPEKAKEGILRRHTYQTLLVKLLKVKDSAASAKTPAERQFIITAARQGR